MEHLKSYPDLRGPKTNVYSMAMTMFGLCQGLNRPNWVTGMDPQELTLPAEYKVLAVDAFLQGMSGGRSTRQDRND